MPIPRPDTTGMPAGRRTLVNELYDLYLTAGAPSLVKIERIISVGYVPRGDATTLSRQGILNTLRGATWPRWESLEGLIRALELIAEASLGSNGSRLPRLRELWLSAVAGGTNTPGQAAPSYPARPQPPPALSAVPELSGLLTAREHEIALLAASGESSRQIADKLTISVRTVEVHMASIMRKLSVNRRSALVPLFTAETSPTKAEPDEPA